MLAIATSFVGYRHGIIRSKVVQDSGDLSGKFWCKNKLFEHLKWRDLRQSSAAYHICSVSSRLALAWRHTSSNSVTRNYCCRALVPTVIYGHVNRSYLLTYLLTRAGLAHCADEQRHGFHAGDTPWGHSLQKLPPEVPLWSVAKCLGKIWKTSTNTYSFRPI